MMRSTILTTLVLTLSMLSIHAAELPPTWKFVSDDWNFGTANMETHADASGKSHEAIRFRFDSASQRKQFADTRAAGGNLQKEAMAGRIYDGAHANLLDSHFADGTIEVDVCSAGRDDFQGIIFRASDEALTSRKFEGEIIYLRPFYANNTSPHYPAIQYFATQRDGANRRMVAGIEKEAAIPKDLWMHLRVVVSGAEAKVFINDETEPAMVIAKLSSGRTEGLVGLWAWSGCLANVKITPVAKQ